MISQTDYHKLTEWLDASRRPLLLTHRAPDGDALGALAGLALALRQRGATPRVALYEPFPPRYAILRDYVSWESWGASGAALQSSCDALVIVDTCAAAQLEPIADFLPRAPRTLVVDHHATRDSIAMRPEDLRLIDESAAAVCVIVAEWARAAGVRLTEPLATALLTGVGTDCGWFRFSNTDARTLRVAAELVAAGAAIDRIYAAIYQQDSCGKVRLIGRMLRSLELHAGGLLAVMYIRGADFAAEGVDLRDTEDLVNEAGRLVGVEGTILFVEQPDHVRVNFRSRSRLDVAALARQFGGGGHERAAGARLRGVWEDCVPRVIAAAVAALGRG